MSSKRQNQKRRVLSVDDDPESLKLVRKALEWEGYQVQIASSGQEALHKISSWHPHLVLLDINMPGLDGKQTLDLLKKNTLLCSIPVLMFTTSGNDKDIKDCYGLGASSYIQKPHSYEDLIKIFRIICKYIICFVKIINFMTYNMFILY